MTEKRQIRQSYTNNEVDVMFKVAAVVLRIVVVVVLRYIGKGVALVFG